MFSDGRSWEELSKKKNNLFGVPLVEVYQLVRRTKRTATARPQQRKTQRIIRGEYVGDMAETEIEKQ